MKLVPERFIGWVLRSGIRHMLIAVSLLSVAALVHMLLPWFLSQIVDNALGAGDRDALLRWSLGMLAVALLNPLCYVIGYRQLMVAEAAARRRTVYCLIDHLNVVGTGARKAVSPGEMINLCTGDNRLTAQVFFTAGHGVMNLAAFIIGTVMVWAIHPWLGVTIGLGVFATAVVAGPLLGRLQKRRSDYRRSLADLTSQAADVVGGLRVLRGIGGEQHFSTRYRRESARLRASAYQVTDSDSWVQALRQAVPVMFIAAITWFGARLALSGTITLGQFSAAFGYATGLVMYSGSLLANVHSLVAIRVAASRFAAIFSTVSDIAGNGGQTAEPGKLYDPEAGLRLSPGCLTVVATTETAAAAGALRRLGRWSESAATWNGAPLDSIDLAQLREQILLLDTDDYLFAGTLSATLRTDDEKALTALETACAADVYTSLGSSLDGEIADSGRNLSGGQRQRLRLARALAAEPEVLLAVEPTAGVDAVTESVIAARIATVRRGRTTVVVSTSPLWMTHADQVVWLAGGKVQAAGDLKTVMAKQGFRAVITRTEQP